MTDRRVLEGIGHHDFDYEGDYLLVDEWLSRPDDLKGQSVTIAKLLPPELRGARLRASRGRGDDRKGQPQKSKFRINVEIDRISAK
jgi:hypothetical protein